MNEILTDLEPKLDDEMNTRAVGAEHLVDRDACNGAGKEQAVKDFLTTQAPATDHMVDRAADEKLDGYRELAQKVADRDAKIDRLRAKLQTERDRAEKAMTEELWRPINSLRLFDGEVMLYKKEWIDADFCPDGIRFGFRNESDDGDVISALWDNDQDCWVIDDDTPTHWHHKKSLTETAEIDRLKARIEELEKPGVGGEFERVAAFEKWNVPPGPDGDKVEDAALHNATINNLTVAHSADLKASEERHRENVRELVSELEYLLTSLPWPDENRARKCIAKYKDGE